MVTENGSLNCGLVIARVVSRPMKYENVRKEIIRKIFRKYHLYLNVYAKYANSHS